MILHRRTGDKVSTGDIIMDVYGKDEDCFVPAMALLEQAVTYSRTKSAERKLIYKEITAL